MRHGRGVNFIARRANVAGVLGVAAMIGLALLSAGCGRGTEEAASNSVGEAVLISAETLGFERVTPKLSFSGSIEPYREASVGAVVGGQIDRIHVEVGERVGEGDLLVTMKDQQLTQAEVRYVVVKKDWERLGRLFEKGAVTEQAFDQADAGYHAAKAAYELILESTRIRAPFDGIVSAVYLEEGEVFVLMPGGLSSTPAIVELVQVDTVRVHIQIPERRLLDVAPGLETSITVDSYTDRKFRGTVRLVEPTLNPRTRTTTVEIVVPNGARSLRPGMYAHVEVELPSRELLLLTRNALIQRDGTSDYYAMVVEGDVAVRRTFELGNSYGESVEVLSGLAAGEHVVTAGRFKIEDGAKVRVRGGEEGN